jgi:hypothetical protein
MVLAELAGVVAEVEQGLGDVRRLEMRASAVGRPPILGEGY